MTHLIKRNDTLAQILKHWNHNNPSNIGLGRLTRTMNDDGIYLINKTWGREDLALFNIKTSLSINGDIVNINNNSNIQLSFEPYGVSYRKDISDLLSIKVYIANWVESNKDELYIQLHYLNWFNQVEIKDLTLEETITVLESYKYDQEEAKVLFDNLNY